MTGTFTLAIKQKKDKISTVSAEGGYAVETAVKSPVISWSVCNNCWIRSFISHQADESQIKQAYRKLAKRYHPDLNPGNPEAEAKFEDIVEAYETLGDLAKRRKYDANMIQI